tara:strand:- start:378 stop:1598 length:1221 start_codon:yes stop_codon:yes gene_type:complete
MRNSTFKLGDITEVITKGTTPTSVGFKFVESGINFVKVESITADGLFLTSKFASISDECNKTLKRSQLQEGDVLFSIAGALGRTALVPKSILPANTNQALAIIRLKSDIAIDKRFLLLALKTSVTMEQVEKYRGGVAQQNLSLGQLKNFEIPDIPISNQKRIVAIIDQAFADIEQARAKTERNLKNARELFENYLQQVFSQQGEEWTETTLGKLCKRVEYGTSSKSQTEGTIPVIRMGNIQDGVIDWEKLVYSDNDVDINKLLLKNGDVLFNRTNSPELVGKTAIYRNERPAIFAGYLIRIHRKEELLDAEYLNYYLNSSIAQEYGRSVMSHSTNQANINGTKLKEYPINVPTLATQELISKKINLLVSEIKSLEAIYQKKLDAIDELKKSILQKAFAGELSKSIA